MQAGAGGCATTDYRRRVLDLVTKFLRVGANPQRRREAIDLLRIIHTRLATYFTLLDLLGDGRDADAAGRRPVHLRILFDVKHAIDRFSDPAVSCRPDEITHVLDAFIIHEVAVRGHESAPLPDARSHSRYIDESHLQRKHDHGIAMHPS
jgi:hypothetical protein